MRFAMGGHVLCGMFGAGFVCVFYHSSLPVPLLLHLHTTTEFVLRQGDAA